MGLPVFGNYSNPQWIAEPNGRETWGLVPSCLLTLGLSVYSAIHLNVFHRDCGWWARGFIRCRLLVVAQLAPEFIVFKTRVQRRQAVRIARMFRRLNEKEETSFRIRTLWAHSWPRVGIFDPERPERQEI